MKKNTKKKIRALIALDQKDGVTKSIAMLNKRLNYLKSKLSPKAMTKSKGDSNQMKYLKFHIKKLRKSL